MARSAVTKSQLGKVSVELGIEGIEQVKKNIAAKLNRMVGLEAKKVFMRAGLILVREERDAVQHLTDHPHLTGKLEAAIFASYGPDNKPNVIVGVRTGGGKRKQAGPNRAPHANPVAHGHGGKQPAPPHPWVPQSVRATKGAMAATIAEGLKEIVET